MHMTITLPSTVEYLPPMHDTEQWLTRTEAAKLLEVQPRTVDAYARDGKLPRYYLARSPRRAPRFRIEDVRALLDVVAEDER